MTVLLNNTNDKIPAYLLKFFKNFINECMFAPLNYFFKFEVSRLNFNSFGQMVRTNECKKTMLIVNFLFVRILLFELMLQP